MSREIPAAAFCTFLFGWFVSLAFVADEDATLAAGVEHERSLAIFTQLDRAAITAAGDGRKSGAQGECKNMRLFFLRALYERAHLRRERRNLLAARTSRQLGGDAMRNNSDLDRRERAEGDGRHNAELF